MILFCSTKREKEKKLNGRTNVGLQSEIGYLKKEEEERQVLFLKNPFENDDCFIVFVLTLLLRK